ncbi:uncharacterized protein [Haliotis cracherodii]|uniref:uncharacterized protein n=1 Tax=Haliotis cracherodii TaxID=6455 RepID=UPI0039E88959
MFLRAECRMNMIPSLTHVLVMVLALQVEDAAETSTSCPEASCIGQAINITCDIAGVYQSIGWSRPDHIEVVTCLRNPDRCYVNTQNYEVVLRSDEKHILRIKNFTTLDSGTWICRDGTDPLRKTCHVTTYEDLGDAVSGLKVNCEPLLADTFRFADVCTGLSADPRVNVTLKIYEAEHTYDELAGDVSIPVNDVAQNVTVTCSVIGPGTNCLDLHQRQQTAICSRPGKPALMRDSSTACEEEPTLGGGVVIAIGVMLAVGVL